MPELPEAEAVVRRLKKQAAKAEIVSAHVGRPKVAAPQDPAVVEKLLRGVIIRGVRRRGKQVLADLSTGCVMRIHLGMTGDVYAVDDYRFRPNTARAWLRLSDDRALVFDDPRVLGRLNVFTPDELEAAIGHLGPEPLSAEFTVEVLAGAARKSKLPAKLFLMDQTKIAGLGNIYAAEALFEARIHPERVIGKLRLARLGRLHQAIVNVLRVAVQSAGTAYSRPGEFLEAEAFQPQVYGRENEPCTACGRKVRRIPQGGRSTYFCPGCQT